jgi:plasmid rolling circle replication initiator protein Rep
MNNYNTNEEKSQDNLKNLFLIEKNKIKWKYKKRGSLIVSDSYKHISVKKTEEYAERGVHKRYVVAKRKVKVPAVVDKNTGEVLNNSYEYIENYDMCIGSYDKNGKRVIDYNGRSEYLKCCANFLEFIKEVESGKRSLFKAGFCKDTLCPMCQWRKSLKIFHNVSKIMDKIEERHKNYVPLFLTLTIKNCKMSELSKTLDKIFKGWHIFLNHSQVERITKGWFRALEVTYNEKSKEFHPHIHAIILVEKSYFKGNDYMKTEEWVRIWRLSAKLDYDPVCDIRRTKTQKGKRKEVAEVAKYTLKDSDILKKGRKKELTDEIIENLAESFKGRRIYAFGGEMKEISKEIGIKKADGGDLVNIDGETYRGDIAVILERYQWHYGFSNYVKIE